jgi:WD40 repeat protein
VLKDQDQVLSVAVCPDGRRVVLGSEDSTLRIWDLDTGACLRVLEGHLNSVESVVVSRNGRRAISASTDGTLRTWDLDTGACPATWCGATAYRGVNWGKPLSSGGDLIVAGCDDGSVILFDLMPPGPLTITTLATWSPAHPIVATGLNTGAITICRWNATSAYFEEIAHLMPNGESISSLRFSLDGMRLCVSSPGTPDRILNPVTLEPAPIGSKSVWARMGALVFPSRRTARTPSSLWCDPCDTSPDGAWRAVIRDGRLVVEAVKP